MDTHIKSAKKQSHWDYQGVGKMVQDRRGSYTFKGT
jgi:hypothetical protein